MKSAPPGWEPHKIVTRIDGWIVDPKKGRGVPAAVADMIARAVPSSFDVTAIRTRMFARHKKVLGHV
ncbi:hypothetical protein JQ616_39010 [Bradyrhizobium tropiciagri]|uniref:hypothetical protein n=1 Tax=Bradyrhizobium tropiciagri TaxID=312253 RepID=UPI001BA7E022|nr:hypothetical protein [Bradyrhizobium tropiciagri]MBR0900983.1 hypothetical protein [Bradyrhizobium tropiciagri]